MSLFRIDVLDASGNQVGTGPVTNVASVSRTRSLDKIGSVEFDLIATDPATAEIGAGRQYKLYHADYGALGTYYHASQTTGAGGMLRVKAYDAQIELARKSCYFRRTFDNVAVSTIISTLLGLVTYWSAGSVESSIGNATASIEGESVFEAISELAATWGRHWRLGTAARTLDFGAFGVDSGIRLIRADTIPRELESNDDVAIVTNLAVTVESEAVVNRLIPLGAGTGTTQLTLEYCTVYDAGYPVEEGTNADGSTFYYIESSTSQTTYGLVEKPFVRSDIRPLTNSETNLQNAANALYQAALATLLKLKQPVTQYEITVTKFDPASVNVGDTVNLVYRGVVYRDDEPYKWLDIDDDLYVLDIAESWNSDGVESVRLTVGTSADRRTADEDIIASLVRAASVTKTHVQTSLTKDRVGPYVRRIDISHGANFRFEIGDETLALNYAMLRFKTRPLQSSVKGASTETVTLNTMSNETVTLNTMISAGSHSHDIEINKVGTDYPTGYYPVLYKPTTDELYGNGLSLDNTFESMDSSGDHSHTLTLNGHTHTITLNGHTHTSTYGIYEDSTYPYNISIWIDGVNRTSALGGTWGSSSATDEDTVEITDYISDQSSLRGTHTIDFYATGMGEIEAEIVMLMTVQAIAVS